MVFAMLQLCYISNLADLMSLFLENVFRFSGSFHCNITIITSQRCWLLINTQLMVKEDLNLRKLDRNNLHASVRQCAPPSDLFVLCFFFSELFTPDFDVRMHSFLSHCRIPVWWWVKGIVVGRCWSVFWLSSFFILNFLIISMFLR